MKHLTMCLVLLAWIAPAADARLRVPSARYPTIQAAIDAAQPNDEIEVAPGTYNESINFMGKALHLYSRAGAARTTISNGEYGSAVTCAGNETSATILEGFTIIGNDVSGPSAGPGMSNSNSSPTVVNCIFSNNYIGMFNSNSSPTVINCTFIGNVSKGPGAGMLNVDSSPTVINCTFWDNSAGAGSSGMFSSGGSPIVTNCIFWDRPGSEIDGPVTVTYSDIQGGFAGEGNIDADPLLDADLRLQAGSPCIDAGSSAALPGDVTTDGAGDPRIEGADVDMGAYESSYKVKKAKP